MRNGRRCAIGQRVASGRGRAVVRPRQACRRAPRSRAGAGAHLQKKGLPAAASDIARHCRESLQAEDRIIVASVAVPQLRRAAKNTAVERLVMAVTAPAVPGRPAHRMNSAQRDRASIASEDQAMMSTGSSRWRRHNERILRIVAQEYVDLGSALCGCWPIISNAMVVSLVGHTCESNTKQAQTKWASAPPSSGVTADAVSHHRDGASSSWRIMNTGVIAADTARSPGRC